MIKCIRRRGKLLTINNRRKMLYTGHISRNNKYLLLQNKIQKRTKGLKDIDWKKKSWFRNIKGWISVSIEELFHEVRVGSVVANLQ